MSMQRQTDCDQRRAQLCSRQSGRQGRGKGQPQENKQQNFQINIQQYFIQQQNPAQYQFNRGSEETPISNQAASLDPPSRHARQAEPIKPNRRQQQNAVKQNLTNVINQGTELAQSVGRVPQDLFQKVSQEGMEQQYQNTQTSQRRQKQSNSQKKYMVENEIKNLTRQQSGLKAGDVGRQGRPLKNKNEYDNQYEQFAHAQAQAQSRAQSYDLANQNNYNILRNALNVDSSDEDSSSLSERQMRYIGQNEPVSTYHQISGEELRALIFFNKDAKKGQDKGPHYKEFKHLMILYQNEIKRRWDGRAQIKNTYQFPRMTIKKENRRAPEIYPKLDVSKKYFNKKHFEFSPQINKSKIVSHRTQNSGKLDSDRSQLSNGQRQINQAQNTHAVIHRKIISQNTAQGLDNALQIGKKQINHHNGLVHDESIQRIKIGETKKPEQNPEANSRSNTAMSINLPNKFQQQKPIMKQSGQKIIDPQSANMSEAGIMDTIKTKEKIIEKQQIQHSRNISFRQMDQKPVNQSMPVNVLQQQHQSENAAQLQQQALRNQKTVKQEQKKSNHFTSVQIIQTTQQQQKDDINQKRFPMMQYQNKMINNPKMQIPELQMQTKSFPVLDQVMDQSHIQFKQSQTATQQPKKDQNVDQMKQKLLDMQAHKKQVREPNSQVGRRLQKNPDVDKSQNGNQSSSRNQSELAKNNDFVKGQFYHDQNHKLQTNPDNLTQASQRSTKLQQSHLRTKSDQVAGILFQNSTKTTMNIPNNMGSNNQSSTQGNKNNNNLIKSQGQGERQQIVRSQDLSYQIGSQVIVPDPNNKSGNIIQQRGGVISPDRLPVKLESKSAINTQKFIKNKVMEFESNKHKATRQDQLSRLTDISQTQFTINSPEKVSAKRDGSMRTTQQSSSKIYTQQQNVRNLSNQYAQHVVGLKQSVSQNEFNQEWMLEAANAGSQVRAAPQGLYISGATRSFGEMHQSNGQKLSGHNSQSIQQLPSTQSVTQQLRQAQYQNKTHQVMEQQKQLLEKLKKIKDKNSNVILESQNQLFEQQLKEQKQTVDGFKNVKIKSYDQRYGDISLIPEQWHESATDTEQQSFLKQTGGKNINSSNSKILGSNFQNSLDGSKTSQHTQIKVEDQNPDTTPDQSFGPSIEKVSAFQTNEIAQNQKQIKPQKASNSNPSLKQNIGNGLQNPQNMFQYYNDQINYNIPKSQLHMNNNSMGQLKTTSSKNHSIVQLKTADQVQVKSSNKGILSKQSNGLSVHSHANSMHQLEKMIPQQKNPDSQLPVPFSKNMSFVGHQSQLPNEKLHNQQISQMNGNSYHPKITEYQSHGMMPSSYNPSMKQLPTQSQLQRQASAGSHHVNSTGQLRNQGQIQATSVTSIQNSKNSKRKISQNKATTSNGSSQYVQQNLINSANNSKLNNNNNNHKKMKKSVQIYKPNNMIQLPQHRQGQSQDQAEQILTLHMNRGGAQMMPQISEDKTNGTFNLNVGPRMGGAPLGTQKNKAAKRNVSNSTKSHDNRAPQQYTKQFGMNDEQMQQASGMANIQVDGSFNKKSKMGNPHSSPFPSSNKASIKKATTSTITGGHQYSQSYSNNKQAIVTKNQKQPHHSQANSLSSMGKQPKKFK